MRIITLQCPDCGTIVAGNVLAAHREMECPGLECTTTLRFGDLPQDQQDFIVDNPYTYRSEDH